MKKLIALITSIMLAAFAFAGCSNGKTADGGKSDSKGKIKIGVIQFGSHPSLDNCYKGVKEALDEAFGDKADIDLQNGNFDSATCDSIAKNMVAKKYDIIIPIATPAATAAYAAAAGTDIPVVFCAVSDPVAAGLVESVEKPGANCTGTSDILNLDAQVDLIKAMQPDVKKIGVLYTTSEANSVSQLKKLKDIAAKKGVEVVEQGVQSASDVPQAASSLAPKVDCINNFTDNNVVNNITTVFEQANAANIPVYGSEVEQVVKGCLASESIDYVSLGKKTGDIAAKILNGEKASGIPVATIEETSPVINTDVAEKFGIEIPEKYKDAQMVKTEQE